MRTCRLGLRALEQGVGVVRAATKLWDARFDALDRVVEELKQKEKRGAKEAIAARKWSGSPTANWS